MKKKTSSILTRRQFQVFFLVCKGNEEDLVYHWLDLDQLIDRMEKEMKAVVTKQAIQFPIRELVEKGLIEKRPAEKRRSARRRILAPTHAGRELMNRISAA